MSTRPCHLLLHIYTTYTTRHLPLMGKRLYFDSRFLHWVLWLCWIKINNILQYNKIIQKLVLCAWNPRNFIVRGGTQFSSFEFRQFEKEWEFNKQVSRPLFSRPNGLAERYVQEVKLLLKKCLEEKPDVQLALLHQRTISQSNLGSPAQRLIGRWTRTILPSTDNLLQPETVQNVHLKLENSGERSRYNSNWT